MSLTSRVALCVLEYINKVALYMMGSNGMALSSYCNCGLDLQPRGVARGPGRHSGLDAESTGW